MPLPVVILQSTFACSRLSVSGDDRRSGHGTSGIWPGIKKLEKAREGEPVSIVLKTSFRPLLKTKTALQGCQMSKSSVLSYSRVYHHFTACFDLLQFLQFLYMSSLSTKISSNIEAYPSKCCRFCQNLQYLKKITTRANDSVVDTARAKRISRNFTGSKKNIKFVYQSGGSVSTLASFK